MSEKHPSFWHDRGYLPHFETDELIQSVTIRLADSLPRQMLDRIYINNALETDLQYHIRLESVMDRGLGDCILRNDNVANSLQNSLLYCNGKRYDLHGWVIMPNHAHILVKMLEGFQLGTEVKAWKSSVARVVTNRDSGRGSVWQADYWDRYIRNETHYLNSLIYFANNPVKAGLVGDPIDWQWSSFYYYKGRSSVTGQRIF